MNADTATRRLPITAADESYTHQLPTPHLETLYVHPNWGDRCYHQLYVDDLTINAGRQLYPHDGRRFAFVGVATPEVQHALRAAEQFAPGDDPDQPRIGGVMIEVVEPLEEIRLVADDPNFPVALDLTFTTRFEPVAADRHRIEQHGEVVTDYLNFFQSGVYNGTIEVVAGVCASTSPQAGAGSCSPAGASCRRRRSTRSCTRRPRAGGCSATAGSSTRPASRTS
jgi:hypothetical protein